LFVEEIPKFVYCVDEESIVAKRRNLKKEKASRNKAYAKQFSHKSSRSYAKNRGFSRNEKRQDDQQENNNEE